MARGSYWACWFPPSDGAERPNGYVDGFLTARAAIASAETSVEQGGGGAVAFSQVEGRSGVLLRKFGKLWPEVDALKEGDQIGQLVGRVTKDSERLRKGQKVRLRTFDLPSRKERRQQRRTQD